MVPAVRLVAYRTAVACVPPRPTDGASSACRGGLILEMSDDTSTVDGGELLIPPLKALNDGPQDVLVLVVEDVVVCAGAVVDADWAPSGPQ
eukprot:1477191-Heterocapsa_arctica.AAC.1